MDDDPYVSQAGEIKRQRGTAIDDPDITAQAAHKGYLQKKLEEFNVPVPPTIVVPREEIEQFELTRQQEACVGVPFGCCSTKQCTSPNGAMVTLTMN